VTHYFSYLGGPVADPTKNAPRHATSILCFSSDGICGSHSAASASGARNVNALFFMLVWAPVDLTINAGTHYGELVFLHPVEFAGYVVRSGASRE
jgi:hypothetical protein